MLGLVRYSVEHVGWNILRFITTKRPEFAGEREVRALIWTSEWAGHDRHIDIDNKCHRKPLTQPPPHVPPGLRRAMDLQVLVDRTVVSPDANRGRLEKVKRFVGNLGYKIPVEESSLTRYSHLLPDVVDIERFSKR